MNANEFLTGPEREQVERAAADAEKHTAAEIVCAVATESGRYDRAESLVGLLFALVGLTLAHAYARGFFADPGSWGQQGGIGLGWQSLVVVVGFVAGSISGSYCPFLRGLFVRRREMEEETDRAASHVFRRLHVRSTEIGTGLLIYVSLFERRAVVLADEQVAAVLGAQEIARLRDIACDELAQGRRVEAFTLTIAAAVEKLAKVIPPKAGDKDELSNRLAIFHPRP